MPPSEGANWGSSATVELTCRQHYRFQALSNFCNLSRCNKAHTKREKLHLNVLLKIGAPILAVEAEPPRALLGHCRGLDGHRHTSLTGLQLPNTQESHRIVHDAFNINRRFRRSSSNVCWTTCVLNDSITKAVPTCKLKHFIMPLSVTISGFRDTIVFSRIQVFWRSRTIDETTPDNGRHCTREDIFFDTSLSIWQQNGLSINLIAQKLRVWWVAVYKHCMTSSLPSATWPRDLIDSMRRRSTRILLVFPVDRSTRSVISVSETIRHHRHATAAADAAAAGVDKLLRWRRAFCIQAQATRPLLRELRTSAYFPSHQLPATLRLHEITTCCFKLWIAICCMTILPLFIVIHNEGVLGDECFWVSANSHS